MRKSLNSKYKQKHLDTTNMSVEDILKTVSKTAIQKTTEATGK